MIFEEVGSMQKSANDKTVCKITQHADIIVKTDHLIRISLLINLSFDRSLSKCMLGQRANCRIKIGALII